MSCRSAGLQARIFIVDTMTRADSGNPRPEEVRAPARYLIGINSRDYATRGSTSASVTIQSRNALILRRRIASGG